MEDISIYERLVPVSYFTLGFCARYIIVRVVERFDRMRPSTKMSKQLDRISAQLDSLPSPQAFNELIAKVNELEGVSSKREKRRKATPPNVTRHINGAA